MVYPIGFFSSMSSSVDDFAEVSDTTCRWFLRKVSWKSIYVYIWNIFNQKYQMWSRDKINSLILI